VCGAQTLIPFEQMGNIGAPEIIGLLLLALLLFGAKRLPEIGRSLGSGMREFKDSVSGTSTPEPPTHTELPVGTQDTTAPAPPRENETVR
jgi:sec-independent protein translocase protein TatA